MEPLFLACYREAVGSEGTMVADAAVIRARPFGAVSVEVVEGARSLRAMEGDGGRGRGRCLWVCVVG